MTAARETLQENGGSEEDIALAVARAHERMLQAELAESQAGPSQPPQPQQPQQPQQQGPARGARTAENASRAASSRQAAQLRAMDMEDVRHSPQSAHHFAICSLSFPRDVLSARYALLLTICICVHDFANQWSWYTLKSARDQWCLSGCRMMPTLWTSGSSAVMKIKMARGHQAAPQEPRLGSRSASAEAGPGMRPWFRPLQRQHFSGTLIVLLERDYW